MAYGCKNMPRPDATTSYPAQDGWANGRGTPWFSRMPVIVDVYHAMTSDCQYSKTTVDAGCVGCRHNQQVQNENTISPLPDRAGNPPDRRADRGHGWRRGSQDIEPD